MNITRVEWRSVRSRLRLEPREFPEKENGRLSEIRTTACRQKREREVLDVMLWTTMFLTLAANYTAYPNFTCLCDS